MPRMPALPAEPPRASAPRATPVSPPSMPRMPAVPNRSEPPSASRLPPVPARAAWEEHPPHPAEVSDRWFVTEAFGPDPSARLEAEWNATWEQNRRQTPLGRHSEPPPAPAAPGGRRRREDPVPELLPDAEEESPSGRRHARQDGGGGGRRRAPEPESDWQELADWDPVVRATRNSRNGSHSRDENRPPPRQHSGSHSTGGHSVADLLAAHGSTEPRRRRRRDG
jgi:hypothetical protein